jgi:TRAP-type C4-dicarboxylate transport system permease small subunit
MIKLAKVSSIIEIGLRSFTNILLFLILISVFMEVVSRYVFGVTHSYIVDFASWWLSWGTFLLIGVVAKARQHVSIELLPSKLPDKYRIPTLIIFDSVNFIFAIFLCWAGIEHIVMYRHLSLTASTGVPLPLWIVVLCVPIGGFFLSLFSIEQLINNIFSLAKNREGKK